MLQPTDWSVTPESLLGEIPARRQQVYALIWDMTVACMMRPPRLIHQRAVLELDGAALGFATLAADPTMLGYWQTRQDWPHRTWPLCGALPGRDGRVVLDMLPVNASACTMATLLARMEQHRVGTPASTAPLLQTLCGADDDAHASRGGRPPLLHLEYDADGLPVALTESGSVLLGRIEAAGISTDADCEAARAALLDRVEAGQLGTRQAMESLGFAGEPRLDGLCAEIDAAIAEWEGTRRPTLKELETEQAEPPRTPGFPAGMDPEALLPAEHPLRAYRMAMEKALAASHPHWATRRVRDQAALRYAWIVAHPPEGIPHDVLSPAAAPYSAMTRWLVGLDPTQLWLPVTGGFK
ncbi:hypothetical protein B1806_04540 [Metallibacterium scheffleri]|uniref:Uncharacterized protein n=1 Tax=Metallibacterium scheffleri TaxID=993689 RepID=A0A4S3KQV1_9GAMM|nr:hypothetical protein B1806_04540 [Metallibacterium scheffleri]